MSRFTGSGSGNSWLNLLNACSSESSGCSASSE